MAKIGELFGVRTEDNVFTSPPATWIKRLCPFTNRKCDVSANRGDRAFFDRQSGAVTNPDRLELTRLYADEPHPLGICTVTTQRRYEGESQPWIICPKRMMELRSSPPILLPEVRSAIPIAPGTDVRCWWEFKFASNEGGVESDAGRFFEFTFDYILMPVDWSSGSAHPRLVGPPYILEIMTSSTRGGGLTEHMLDAMMLRPQRNMRGSVKSPYTPNYRQVFGRMASQLFAKSEVAAAWGGKTIWILQDVLLRYIQQTTAFSPKPFETAKSGNVNLIIYKLAKGADDLTYDLQYDKTLIGNSRRHDANAPDFTSMLGVGYVPPLSMLISTLERTQARTRASNAARNWIDFKW